MAIDRKTIKLKNAKKHSPSSQRWLRRQLNDPFVEEAKKQGYRSRAAFKLIEMAEKHSLFKDKKSVVDLGSTPGGWSQVCRQMLPKSGRVVAIDINDMAPIPDVEFLKMDFSQGDAPEQLISYLNGRVDVVLSDMAAPATGHTATDHLKIMGLVEMALDFAEAVLNDEGHFVAKVLQGGTEKKLLDRLKKNFAKVSHSKPSASRSDSSEMYVVALHFRGNKSQD